jgi:hypothetical protein
MLPVGSIIASILTPKDFAIEIERNGLKQTWVLADGQALPELGRLAEIMRNRKEYEALNPSNVAHAPALSGMFLRGRTPDRQLGSKQEDSVGPHTHPVAHTYPNHINAPDLDAGNVTLTLKDWRNVYPAAPEAAAGPNGGEETRPKNVAVNYYIRIS